MALSVKQVQELNTYLKNNPKCSREQAIVTLFGVGSAKTNKGTSVEHTSTSKTTIILPSGRKIVKNNGNICYYANDGTRLNEKYFKQQEGEIDIKPSGRYSVTKNGKTKYYAKDGTELNAKYFNQVENPSVIVKTSDGKNINLNKTIELRINNLTKKLKKAEKQNGFIGKAWSGTKNLLNVGASSDKVRELQAQELKLLNQFNSNPQIRAKVFKELTGADFTPENQEKFVKDELKLKSEQALADYQEGQKEVVDVVADISAGFASSAVVATATVTGVVASPFTGGASLSMIAGGLALGGAIGSGVKMGVKYADAKSAGREYTTAGQDALTGAGSGVIGVLTLGSGSVVGNATKAGLTRVVGKEVMQEGVKQTTKQAVTKTAVKATSFVVANGTEGALFGGIDNGYRTAIEGGSIEEVFDATIDGAEGGFVGGVFMGGAFKGVKKGYKSVKGAISKDVPKVSPKTPRTNQAPTSGNQEYTVDEFGQIHSEKPVEVTNTEKPTGYNEDGIPQYGDDKNLSDKMKALKERARQKQQSTTNVTQFSPYNQTIPKGHVLDKKTGKIIKVDTNKIKTSIDKNARSIVLYDEYGNNLGSVMYDGGFATLSNGTKALHFEGLVSEVEGLGIGTKLINELKNISKELGYEGRLHAKANPDMVKNLGNRPRTNIGFYYKVGFRAIDPEKNKLIEGYIKNNKEIPLDLNIFTEIELL